MAGLHALNLHEAPREQGEHDRDGKQRDADAPAWLGPLDAQPAGRAARRPGARRARDRDLAVTAPGA